jgi:two-component system cell cycle response regulator CpdR
VAKILIVDDDETDRVGLATILEQAGHTVLTAGDGDEALEAFLAERVHLVVTDMVMPGRDGLGLISALREVDPGAEIIAISGKSPGQLEASKVFGARKVLSKPIDRQDLLDAVEEVVGAPEGDGAS